MSSDAGYGLVMPFVVCQSAGGPYDDDAFVAGYECGRLEMVLAQGPESVELPVHTASVPQVDLIAMKQGYAMTAERWEDGEEWTSVSLTKGNTP